MYKDPLEEFLKTAPINPMPIPVPVQAGEKKRKKKRAPGEVNKFTIFKRFMQNGMTPNLPDSVVYVFLWWHAHKETHVCTRGSIKDIARHTQVSARAVQNALKRLTEGGFIERVRQGHRSGIASAYRVLLLPETKNEAESPAPGGEVTGS